MDAAFYQRFDTQLAELREQGLFKTERVIASPQSGQIRANGAEPVVAPDASAGDVMSTTGSAFVRVSVVVSATGGLMPSLAVRVSV